MTAPTRDEAIDALAEACGALDRLVAAIPPEAAVKPATIGGGEWSTRDLIGHMAFWEELALEALEQIRAGQRPRVEEVFEAGATGVDAVNADNFRRTSEQSLEEVLARKATSHAAIVEAIRAMSEEEWLAAPPYPAKKRRSTAELLSSTLGAAKRPFGHAFAHLPDLEAFVSTIG